MDYITARRLQHEFKLPAVLAREIDTECTLHALRYRWQPWAWLMSWLLLPALVAWSAWLPSCRHLFHGEMLSVLYMVIVLTGWVSLARWLAGPAMRVAAAAKSRRLGIGIKENADA